MKTQSRVSLLVAFSLLAGAAMVLPALADRDDDRCAGSRDVKLVNGKIHTFDARNSIVSSVTIKNGKFAAVGDDGQSDGGPCMQVINLGAARPFRVSSTTTIIRAAGPAAGPRHAA